MPQKKKATTKKGMKKSINTLCKVLDVEKAKHSKASSLVGKYKQNMQLTKMLVNVLKSHNNALKEKLKQCEYDRKITDNYTAKLVKEVANIE